MMPWTYVETQKLLQVEVSPPTGPSTASVSNNFLVQIMTPHVMQYMI